MWQGRQERRRFTHQNERNSALVLALTSDLFYVATRCCSLFSPCLALFSAAYGQLAIDLCQSAIIGYPHRADHATATK